MKWYTNEKMNNYHTKNKITKNVLLNFVLPGVLLHAVEEIGASSKQLVIKYTNVINTYYIILRIRYIDF